MTTLPPTSQFDEFDRKASNQARKIQDFFLKKDTVSSTLILCLGYNESGLQGLQCRIQRF